MYREYHEPMGAQYRMPPHLFTTGMSCVALYNDEYKSWNRATLTGKFKDDMAEVCDVT